MTQAVHHPADILLHQGSLRRTDAVQREHLHGQGMRATARQSDADSPARQLRQPYQRLVTPVDDPERLVVQAAQADQDLAVVGAGQSALEEGDIPLP